MSQTEHVDVFCRVARGGQAWPGLAWPGQVWPGLARAWPGPLDPLAHGPMGPWVQVCLWAQRPMGSMLLTC